MSVHSKKSGYQASRSGYESDIASRYGDPKWQYRSKRYKTEGERGPPSTARGLDRLNESASARAPHSVSGRSESRSRGVSGRSGSRTRSIAGEHEENYCSNGLEMRLSRGSSSRVPENFCGGDTVHSSYTIKPLSRRAPSAAVKSRAATELEIARGLQLAPDNKHEAEYIQAKREADEKWELEQVLRKQLNEQTMVEHDRFVASANASKADSILSKEKAGSRPTRESVSQDSRVPSVALGPPSAYGQNRRAPSEAGSRSSENITLASLEPRSVRSQNTRGTGASFSSGRTFPQSAFDRARSNSGFIITRDFQIQRSTTSGSLLHRAQDEDYKQQHPPRHIINIIHPRTIRRT